MVFVLCGYLLYFQSTELQSLTLGSEKMVGLVQFSGLCVSFNAYGYVRIELVIILLR